MGSFRESRDGPKKKGNFLEVSVESPGGVGGNFGATPAQAKLLPPNPGNSCSLPGSTSPLCLTELFLIND